VETQRVGETGWQPVKLNDTFCPGDTLRANRRSRAEIILAKSILRLNANTTLTLKDIKENDTASVNLLEGATYFFSLAPKSLEVVTPSANAAVRGTEFFISVEDSKTSLTIFEGEVLASNQAGSLTLARGQSAVASLGQAPAQQVVARPQDAVRWALHYPPVVNVRPGEFPGSEFYQKGDLRKAFDSIDNAQDSSNPRFLTYRASLLLAVGRVDEADKDIKQALSLNSKNSDAFALQSVIAVAQNDKGEAFSKAQQAVQADSKSASAQIALSYAQQAKFDLGGALTSAQIATQLEPNNALAWARLAELQSAHGHSGKALDAAAKAVSINPNLSRTQPVLGFAHLVKEDTDAARAAFQKAIQFDQADPLPKLGQGLAKIRDDQLAEGRSDLEAAVNLDPNNSLMRSYLGKAYYEEKRSEKASEQFAIAKKKDPKDPTPYLYDAIEKQTTNRPVEALHNMQTAIELNNNRAPFRSKLLLDSDLASRSAAVGRIYTDLGFQNRALLEGWKSVNTDNTNFAAHRFLADSYSVLPRHEIARVSELLQSQMLQSSNMTPIQPRLAESNLFLISAGGPGATSFNEFNPLFKSNGITLQASGLVGDNNTFGGEGIISGIYDKASFSFGYSQFDTDGWRTGGFQEDRMGNFFGQYDFTPDTSIQAEYRLREFDTGDLGLRFQKDKFEDSFERNKRTESIRGGLRHSFSPNNTVLVSVMYSEENENLHDDQATDALFTAVFPPGAGLVVDVDSPDLRSHSVEGQHLFRSKYLNLTSGVGYFDINGEITSSALAGPPLVPVCCVNFGIPTLVQPINIRHLNLYTYAQIKPLDWATLTAGVSYDSLEGDLVVLPKNDRSLVNPKFGLLLEPFKGTTLRAAAFRFMKRTLITNQTLEPTQVAGFNQFFDDLNFTDGWRYGVGIDQKISQDWLAGVEYSIRDLTVPFAGPGGTPTEADWDEKNWRGYLYWTPHKWVALRAEYLYERLKRDPRFPEGVQESKTHRIPLGISVYHPSGLSAGFTSTYFRQQGQFGGFLGVLVADPILPGKDDFWVTDLAVNYRLPKRTGFISLGVTNLFDEDFQYYDSDQNNPAIQPERTAFVRVTLQIQ
jgi:tetratricopeptide (TPR) repeat protein